MDRSMLVDDLHPPAHPQLLPGEVAVGPDTERLESWAYPSPKRQCAETDCAVT